MPFGIRHCGLLLGFCFVLRVYPVHGCSFVVTNFNVSHQLLGQANLLNQLRGPDVTHRVDVGGWMFVHNLLWMTGQFTKQPFINGKTVAIFNGEVYNYQELFPDSGFKSDGYVLLPSYKKWGEEFGPKLDGEYAVMIVDFERERVVLLSDPFGTKPFFFGWGSGGKFGAASLPSVLEGLGLPKDNIFQVEANSMYTASFEELQHFGEQATPLVAPYREKLNPKYEGGKHRLHVKHFNPAPWPFKQFHPVYKWDLRQYKETTHDWNTAFLQAIKKRTRGLIWPAFVGLSAGFDSGVIHLALSILNVEHQTFTVTGSEDDAIIEARLKQGKQSNSWRLALTQTDIDKERLWLTDNVEPLAYELVNKEKNTPSNVLEDPASVGLSFILKKCREKGVKVYFSGSGADEIISDYAKNGKAIWKSQSDFEGKFPDDLDTIFPWRNFFHGKMHDYLMKEEGVGGAHGMETRYPFLDRDLVQEYFWLSNKVKNSKYKRPIRDMFIAHDYPFNEVKKGFDVKAAKDGAKPPADDSDRALRADVKAPGKSPVLYSAPPADNKLPQYTSHAVGVEEVISTWPYESLALIVMVPFVLCFFYRLVMTSRWVRREFTKRVK